MQVWKLCALCAWLLIYSCLYCLDSVTCYFVIQLMNSSQFIESPHSKILLFFMHRLWKSKSVPAMLRRSASPPDESHRAEGRERIERQSFLALERRWNVGWLHLVPNPRSRSGSRVHKNAQL
jgi:hypothetical protein